MQAIFFDLDGTLTESGPGIIKAVQYALNKMGCPETDPQKLRFFIGPPLLDSMLRFRPFSQEEAEKAVELYHAYYCKEGIFDNRVYPGIRQMLKNLRTSNVKLAVASSKPEILVRQILDHFGLSQYFDEVVGASMDGQRSKKAAVIEEALRRLGLVDLRKQVLMVGDTASDVNGAKVTQLDCWGVSYGYGTVEELRTAGAAKILATVPVLEQQLITLQSEWGETGEKKSF